MKKFLTIASLTLTTISAMANEWITDKTSDGSIIMLSDGSVWKIDSYDRLDSMLWMVTDDIIVHDDKLINTDEDEIVDATQIN